MVPKAKVPPCWKTTIGCAVAVPGASTQLSSPCAASPAAWATSVHSRPPTMTVAEARPKLSPFTVTRWPPSLAQPTTAWPPAVALQPLRATTCGGLKESFAPVGSERPCQAATTVKLRPASGATVQVRPVDALVRSAASSVSSRKTGASQSLPPTVTVRSAPRRFEPRTVRANPPRVEQPVRCRAGAACKQLGASSASAEGTVG